MELSQQTQIEGLRYYSGLSLSSHIYSKVRHILLEIDIRELKNLMIQQKIKTDLSVENMLWLSYQGRPNVYQHGQDCTYVHY